MLYHISAHLMRTCPVVGKWGRTPVLFSVRRSNLRQLTEEQQFMECRMFEWLLSMTCYPTASTCLRNLFQSYATFHCCSCSERSMCWQWIFFRSCDTFSMIVLLLAVYHRIRHQLCSHVKFKHLLCVQLKKNRRRSDFCEGSFSGRTGSQGTIKLWLVGTLCRLPRFSMHQHCTS